MQDNEHKLQQAEGGTEQTSDNIKAPLEESPISEPNVSEEAASENKEENKTESSDSKEDSAKDSDSPNDPIDEIDESNAEDAEDTDNEKRHYIPFLDYHSMPMENLVGELQKLVRNEKVQAIGKHVSAIKYEFA